MKITVDCTDTEDYNKISEAIMDSIGTCNVSYFKRHEELMEKNISKSERDSARIIANEKGESKSTARSRIRRGRVDAGASTVVKRKPSSKKTYLEHLRLVKNKTSDSIMESSRIIAQKTGDPVDTIKHRIERGRKSQKLTPKQLKEKNNTTKQRRIWRVVERRLSKFVDYLEDNCETPADISEDLKQDLYRHMDAIYLFRKEL